KANVVADALSRKEREPPLRVRALVMTISLDLPRQILNAQTEARKPKNNKEEDVGDQFPPGYNYMSKPSFAIMNPPPSVDPQAPKVIAPIAEVILSVQAESTSSPSSTTVDQYAPSPSKYHTIA
nr:reverse transcriptase domain-containing protein [Tanacetum cinerariifolium]